MDKSWVPFVVGLIALLVGWVIGFFDSNMRTAKKIREAEARAAHEVEMARKAAEVAAPGGEKPNLLRVWQDASQKLNLELDGHLVNPKTLAADQNQRLKTLLTQMRPWLKDVEILAPKPAAPAAVPEPEKVFLAPAVAVAVAGEKAGPELPALNRPGSMIDQINTILQKKVIGTPLEKKGICLQESLGGGLNIFVGLKRYEGIDAVPDEDVKLAIRQAVAEWERTNM